MRSLWLDTHPVRPSADVLTPGARYDTVVAGAGLTGLTTAVLLARAGHQVAVVEARSVGAVATGNTTAKVSLLQGTNLSSIRSHQSDEVLQAYVEANREGQAWLLRHLEDNGLEYQRRTSLIYANGEQGISSLEKELDAAQAAGLNAVWTETTELPHPVAGAVALADQAQFHPTEVLDALTVELRERGGVIFEGVRVTDAKTDDDAPVQVQTTAGDLHADQLVLATGAPVLDRGGYFAKLKGHRSYAMAFRVPQDQDIPMGMYLSVDSPSRSTRTADINGEQLLLVGGNGHVVGRTSDHQGAVDDLRTWTTAHFPGAELTHSWSAQDYRPADYVPFFGKLPRGGGHIYLATGYNKWGMTNGVAAALAISSEILGGHMPWAQVLTQRSATVSGVLTGVKDNLTIGARMAGDWASAELHSLPDEAPEEGQGVVGRVHGKPVGVSTVDGTTRKVSAICPHMGGVLNWNDAECSWDCPLHASRFAADGTLLEGPAVSNLETAE
ncbi:FAD-dependent oxidoreductase [Nesterenkonia massiliensis]|uniref:FAD-dependent oxidoreductase n=1 Tax=Nesterenkonia massiliensis TaxID=1232429 RepID=UPI0004209ABF|nr:FAD-dependent oxidoreductase [Nesterenkonia massiliensis]